MKKILALFLTLCPLFSYAQVPWSVLMQVEDGSNSFNRTYFVGPPAQDSLFKYNVVTNVPEFVAVGTAGAAVVASALASDARTAIDAFAVPAGTTAQYVRGDGTLATFPAVPGATAQSSASRSLNTAFQVSTTRGALVFYSVQATITASISGGQNGDVILEIASDSGFTLNVQTLSISGTGQTYTLAIALQGVQPQTGVVSGYVPAAMWARLRPVSNTGSPSFAYRAGQEVLIG